MTSPLLLGGPLGSGKTTHVLACLREALKAGRAGVRLLVPTATMAEHLRHRLTREGYAFQPALISTLSRFIERWVPDLPEAGGPDLYLLTEKAIQALDRPEFALVAHMPGFAASLARLIEEFSSTGCSARRLRQVLAAPSLESPLRSAFLAIYEEVSRQLEARGWATRADRLMHAAARIRQSGVGEIETVWMDGFLNLSDPELSVVEALSIHTELTVTAPHRSESIPRLRRMGFAEQSFERRRSSPEAHLFAAPTIDQEAMEIGRRILEQVQAGTQFREMGIIVRSPETYASVLRTALERFGIPARFYFTEPLSGHGVVRYLAGTVDAILAAADHEAILAALKPAFVSACILNDADRFDFSVREQLPGQGLNGLVALGESSRPLALLIESLRPLELWHGLALTAPEWAARAKSLRGLFAPPQPLLHSDYLEAFTSRSQSAALDALDRAMEEAARVLGDEAPLPLQEFWRTAKAVLRLTPLRVADARHNVAHVMSVYEARQWELPVVFVCGLVEKQFPRYHPQEPIFPDAIRGRLQAEGIRVETAAERDAEEHFLFDLATSRATRSLTLSYPVTDAEGKENLPSFLLESIPLQFEESRNVRPRPSRTLQLPASSPAIRDARLLTLLAERHPSISPTALERHLACAFQFFAGNTLRLEAAPARSEDRLDPLTEGEIIHQVLAAARRRPEPLALLFERSFQKACETNLIPTGYRTEARRIRMLEDLRRFAEDDQWPQGLASQTEVPFNWLVDDGLLLRGRIDRIDRLADGRVLILDYKYSRRQRVRDRVNDETLLQAPLYVLAAERVLQEQVTGVYYCSLRGEIYYAGWNIEESRLEIKAEPLTREWLAAALEAARRGWGEIREGRIAPHPADPNLCPACDFRDVCRYKAAPQALVASEELP